MTPLTHWGVLAVATAAPACASDEDASPAANQRQRAPAPALANAELLPGGDTTVDLGSSASFLRPAANLDDKRKPEFYAGAALATQPWIRAPTLTDARDGLGPIYNARSCLACHVKGGRGQAAGGGEPVLATLVRLSLPGRGQHGLPIPDPVYGTQLQSQSTALSHQMRGHPGADAVDNDGPPPEAQVSLTWSEVPFGFPDGETIQLRKPQLVVDALGYGPLHPQTRLSLRHAPSLAGVGLLELIDQSDIDQRADPDDRDGDGISGRVNQVWDPESQTLRPGRLGLKANQPSVRVQVAAALWSDMGLSNPVFTEQPCTAEQARCLAAPTGNDELGFEVGEGLLSALVFFTMSLGLPARRAASDPAVQRGREDFNAAGCDDCHAPHYVTSASTDYPHLAGQDIWPYSDLLLHAMGADLADGREDFEATGEEWRTPPLWGAGLAQAMHQRVGFLHDGRARTIEEAIVWHGGEARASRDRFVNLDSARRHALVAFVRSL